MYVILTGSKNNAGDFLIKYRAKALFADLRNDRALVDIDAWIPFTQEQLETVNNSKALILLGGPALRNNMRPAIYPMTKNLDDIKVPILTMGIGWKSLEGSWEATKSYPFNAESVKLLDRVENSGFKSGLRDYHSLNALMQRGYKNFIMTGCPALYYKNNIGAGYNKTRNIENISYSLGVGFVNSATMEISMKEDILMLSKLFKGKNFQVVFHHALNEEFYKEIKTHTVFSKKHTAFANWLKDQGIKFIDISGSAENLVDHYSKCDLHVGYRVHAHIFMNSISHPTILLNEDGRGKALFHVIGGLILDGYKLEEIANKEIDTKGKLHLKAINAVRKRINPASFGHKTIIHGVKEMSKDLELNIRYEIENNFPRISGTRMQIDAHYEIMKKFILQLP